jgi:hypothetical protein
VGDTIAVRYGHAGGLAFCTESWALPLQLCWASLRNAGSRLLERIPAPVCDWDATDQAFQQGLRTLVKDMS